ncbi:MAG: hypothetical protein RSE41_00270 [Clostridia bacterium]
MSENINEHYLTILPNDPLSLDKKQMYINEIWDIFQIAYAPMGGFKTANTKEELIQKADLWKLVKRNNEITAVFLYNTRKGGGRKAIAGAAKKGHTQDFLSIFKEDLFRPEREVWGECSGPVEALINKFNAPYIPYEYAEKILKGKNIIPGKDDNEKNEFRPGYHYEREIGGSMHRKIMFGHLPKEMKTRLNLN